MDFLPARALVAAGRALPDAALAELGNPAFETAAGRVLVVRLSPWRDVDRSSSHLLLLAEARRACPEAFLDLAFLPERQERDLLDAAGLPWFLGGASGRGPADFDLILVSNAFGLELVNLAALWATAGLPLLASERSSAEAAARTDGGPTSPLPLAILGGSNAAACGPLFDGADDSLVDGLFAGEGEGAIGALCATLLRPGLGRVARLEAAAREVPGFHPALHPGAFPVTPRILAASPPPFTDPLLLSSPESSTTRLQITAGCPGLCSFCLEGWDRRPYREASLEDLSRAALDLKARTGATDLELYSFNFNTHAEVATLVFELGRIFRRVNLMSQRLDILAEVPGLLEAELAADKRSFTLGVEGISARLRAWYRKGLDGRDLEALMDLLVRRGIKELKLFYIISGLEEEADLGEFAAFLGRLAARREAAAPGLRLLASAGFLVRLPRTPLQYAPLALERSRLEGIAVRMEAAASAEGVEFRLASHYDEYGADQLLSLGDGRLLPWLSSCHAEGHVYDGSLDRRAWPSLEAAARRSGLLGPDFLGEKGPEWRPPLAFLEADGRTLYGEYEKARAGRDREACLGGTCSGCGACPDGESIAAITGHRIEAPTPDLVGRLGRLLAAKAGFAPYYVSVNLPPGLAGGTRAYQGAWILRWLLGGEAEAGRRLFEVAEALFDPEGDFGLPEGFVGSTVLGLYGPKAEAIRHLAEARGLAPAPLDREGRLLRPRRIGLRLDLPRLPEGLGAGRLGGAPGAPERASGADPEVLEALRAWLREASVAAVELGPETARRLEPAAKDLKKAFLYGAWIESDPRVTVLHLELGPKARLSGLLGRLGLRARLARVTVVDLG